MIPEQIERLADAIDESAEDTRRAATPWYDSDFEQTKARNIACFAAATTLERLARALRDFAEYERGAAKQAEALVRLNQPATSGYRTVDRVDGMSLEDYAEAIVRRHYELAEGGVTGSGCPPPQTGAFVPVALSEAST